MTAIGGSLEGLILDGRAFPATADAEAQRKLGGWMNEAAANGDGGARLIKTRELWTLDGLTIVIDDDRGDQEYLQELADRKDFFPIAATYPSGMVLQGTGQITGDLQASSQSASAPISLTGPGKLTQQ